MFITLYQFVFKKMQRAFVHLFARKAFTLVEMTIALTVFVIFVATIFTSFLFIVRAQRDAKAVRDTYDEAQQIMDFMVNEIRSGTVDYACYINPSDFCRAENVISIVSRDGLKRIVFQKEGDALQFVRQEKQGEIWQNQAGFSSFQILHSDQITIDNLIFRITPLYDPYDFDNVAINAAFYQPAVRISLVLKGKSYVRPEGIVLSIQTTVSSRIYNRI